MVCIVEPVYSGGCVRQPSPCYSHLVQAPSGKTLPTLPYVTHLLEKQPPLYYLQPLTA